MQFALPNFTEEKIYVFKMHLQNLDPNYMLI